jgi:phytoene synthase
MPESPALAASYDACARVARRQAGNFYPSFLLLPADRRRSMCALYAFMRRTDDIADEPGTLAAKRAALGDWRAAVDGALGGGPAPGDWPGWPALADAAARHGIPARYLHDVIDGVAMDLEPGTFATFEDLYPYCYRVASAVGLCCLHVWGYESAGGRAEAMAEACGVAFQLTNILRDVGEDARNGRVYLPQDDLARFGVGPADLTAPGVNEPLRRLLEFEAGRAERYYREARGLVALVDPAGRRMLRAIVAIYRGLLDEIARRGFEVLRARVSVPRWRKVMIVLRSYAEGPRGVARGREVADGPRPVDPLG